MTKNYDNKPDAFYSRKVKAGQRSYYIDAKTDSKGNNYIVLTESKNVDQLTGRAERHRIFIYQEDFAKLSEALLDVVAHASTDEPDLEPTPIAAPEDSTNETDSLLADAEESLHIKWEDF